MNIDLNPGPRARTVKPGPRHLRTRPDPGRSRPEPYYRDVILITSTVFLFLLYLNRDLFYFYYFYFYFYYLYFLFYYYYFLFITIIDHGECFLALGCELQPLCPTHCSPSLLSYCFQPSNLGGCTAIKTGQLLLILCIVMYIMISADYALCQS